VPQDKLFQYLKDIGDGSIAKETPDCSVTPFQVSKSKQFSDLADSRLISTTDFFYPLVEDPYM
jgi:selenide,water dikinase